MEPVSDPLTHVWDCLHIDVDGLVYSVLNTMEERTYLCEDGTEHKYKREAMERGEDGELLHGEVVRLVQRPEVTKSVIGAYRSAVRSVLGCYQYKDYKCPMSHHQSDLLERNRIAVTAPYKGNRRHKFNPRPVHYAEARVYTISTFNGFVVNPKIEADDWLGLHQRENTLLISKDKDLNSVPGHHINLNTGEYFFVDPDGVGDVWLTPNRKDLKGIGFKWFCAQMLLGDASDNIRGVKGFGPVKVEGLLAPLESKQACWDLVKDTYRKHDGGDGRVSENAQLLWIPHRWDCLSNWLGGDDKGSKDE